MPASQYHSARAAQTETLGEFFRDKVAELGGYDPRSERAQQKFAATLVYYGSVAVAGATTVGLLWKLGVLPRLMPKPVRGAVQRAIDRVAARTEPPKVTALDRGVAKHLSTVYFRTGVNFVVSFAGVYTFFKFPYIPLPLALAATAVPALVVVALPKEHVNPRSRRAAVLASTFGCGYAFGPLNWIAYDTTIFGGVSALATSFGFTAAALLTRGKVSFFVLSQLMSSAAAVIGCHQVLNAKDGYSLGTSRQRATTAAANVNGILFLQLVSNIGLAALHSLPTLLRYEKRAQAHRDFKHARGIPDEETIELPEDDKRFGAFDPDKESLIIFGVAMYATWTWFRHVAERMILKAMGRHERETRKGVMAAVRSATPGTHFTEAQLQEAALLHERIGKISDFAASLVALYLYVRFVGFFQAHGNVNRSFETARTIFARLSPVVLIA